VDGPTAICELWVIAKTTVVLWVPVAGKGDILEVDHNFVDDGDDTIAAFNGECATGTKIILYVYDEERVGIIDRHYDFS
jgi:hypothetical protein